MNSIILLSVPVQYWSRMICMVQNHHTKKNELIRTRLTKKNYSIESNDRLRDFPLQFATLCEYQPSVRWSNAPTHESTIFGRVLLTAWGTSQSLRCTMVRRTCTASLRASHEPRPHRKSDEGSLKVLHPFSFAHFSVLGLKHENTYSYRYNCRVRGRVRGQWNFTM